MRIYSNSFIHYTKSIDAIKGIIEHGFYVHFCKEEIYSESGKTSYIGIPMTCFCDIPLSHIGESKYGEIGIGMNRMWGVQHYLQPVLYYPNNKNCESTKMVMKAEKAFKTDKKDYEAYKILGYAKPMFKLNKANKEVSNYNNSNYIDREYRRLYQSKGQHKWQTVKEYNNNTQKKHIGSPLKFSVKDIDFIIIKREHFMEIFEFIQGLNMIGGKEKEPITQEKRILLISKIMIYETLIGNI